jgi:hypothetical protein
VNHPDIASVKVRTGGQSIGREPRSVGLGGHDINLRIDTRNAG